MSFEPKKHQVDHLFTSPKLSVTELGTTAYGDIDFNDQFFVETDEWCKETITRKTVLHVNI